MVLHKNPKILYETNIIIQKNTNKLVLNKTKSLVERTATMKLILLKFLSMQRLTLATRFQN